MFWQSEDFSRTQTRADPAEAPTEICSPHLQGCRWASERGTLLPSQLLLSNTSDDGMNQWSRGNLNI